MLLCTQHTVAIFFFPGRVVFGYYIESMEKKEKKKQASKQLLFLFVFYIYVSHIYFAVSSSFLLGSFPTRLSALPQLLPDSLLQMGEMYKREKKVVAVIDCPVSGVGVIDIIHAGVMRDRCMV